VLDVAGESSRRHSDLFFLGLSGPSHSDLILYSNEDELFSCLGAAIQFISSDDLWIIFALKSLQSTRMQIST
jgi:hypothetical protein